MSQISYSAPGAAEATGVSESLIREAVRDGDLEGRYARTKLIIEHDALTAWVQSLPTEKPEVTR